MKILTAQQIKEADLYTINNEPISSIDLMERASKAFVERFAKSWGPQTHINIFSGPGNNGGDAMVVARLLSLRDYKIDIYIFNTSNKAPDDWICNYQKLKECVNVNIIEITTAFSPKQLTSDDVIIDGLFGTGLNRPLTGGFASVVKYINSQPCTVVSIDIPSGLMCEDNTYNVMNHIVKAHYTFSFQFPKLAFFFADTSQYVGEWEILDIGIRIPESENFNTDYILTSEDDINGTLKKRNKFAHKGTMGHASLVAGKKGMAGAAILSSKACMRTGVGKLTLHTQECNALAITTSIPEVVLDIEHKTDFFCRTFDATPFDAMAIGPGIGTDEATAQAFIEQIRLSKSHTIIDADAINILGSHRGWIQQLPHECILTPHKKELFGLISSTRNCYEELEKTRELSIKQNIYIVIKGAYSAITTPEGKCYFNPTGNPGMATAGSGDVLTGIILSLLAQEYTPFEACRLGVYIHGLAGDIAAEKYGEECMIASDIISCLPDAFKIIRNIKNQ